MPTILRATDNNMATASVAFNFDDMADQAKKYLDQVRVEAKDRRQGPAGGAAQPESMPRPARPHWPKSIRSSKSSLPR